MALNDKDVVEAGHIGLGRNYSEVMNPEGWVTSCLATQSTSVEPRDQGQTIGSSFKLLSGARRMCCGTHVTEPWRELVWRDVSL